MEDNAEDAYESISKDELAKLKDNIGVFIENVIGQENLENAYIFRRYERSKYD